MREKKRINKYANAQTSDRDRVLEKASSVLFQEHALNKLCWTIKGQDKADDSQ